MTDEQKAGLAVPCAETILRNTKTLHPTARKQMTENERLGGCGLDYVPWAVFKSTVEALGPYKDELLKIAEAAGEGDDPFAAWEVIEPMLEAARLADAVQPAAGEGGLLPCPLCGGADVHLRQSPKHCMSWVSCTSCGLEAPSETGVTDAQAIIYWNARAALSTSVPAGVVENKKEALERVQSWVRNARTDLLTTDPEYWPKHNTLKSLGQFLREEVSALAPPAQEPTR